MSTKNPLIDESNHHQTLHNIHCALAYLRFVAPIDNQTPNSDESYGLWMLNECILDAMAYAKERGQELESKAEEAEA